MASTVFVNNVTLTDADWFNDLDRLHYTIFNDPAAASNARTALTAAVSGANGDITSMTALTAPTVAANPVRATDLQAQTVTAFPTGGTGSAFTITPSPAITANAAKQRFTAILSAAPSGSPTMAVSGQTALNFKYWGASGAKYFVTADEAPSGYPANIYNDSTDWMLLNPLRGAVKAASTTGVSLTSATAANVTSISLSAGEWSITGNVIYTTSATTTVRRLTQSISSVSATVGNAETLSVVIYQPDSTLNTPTNGKPTLPVNTTYLTLSATTTIYLVSLTTFGTSTLTADGYIQAVKR